MYCRFCGVTPKERHETDRDAPLELDMRIAELNIVEANGDQHVFLIDLCPVCVQTLKESGAEHVRNLNRG